MRKLNWLALIALLVSTTAWALPNDKYGRTVTGPVTSGGFDTYTVTGVNSFQMSFPQGAAQAVVYNGIEAQAPAGTLDYACLDANGVVTFVYHRYTTAMMDALVPGTCASYQQVDPAYPPPPPGSNFNPGAGNGNYSVPMPYLPGAPANWPNPPPPPLLVQGALDRLANRMSNVTLFASARALNSTFTPGPVRLILGCYTVRISCSITLGGTCTGTAQLVSDGATPPTTVRTQTQMSLGGTLIVGLTITNAQEVPLCYIVPPGQNVRINTVTGAGSPTFSITQQIEEVLGPG